MGERTLEMNLHILGKNFVDSIDVLYGLNAVGAGFYVDEGVEE